jgi:hypothetical protein
MIGASAATTDASKKERLPSAVLECSLSDDGAATLSSPGHAALCASIRALGAKVRAKISRDNGRRSRQYVPAASLLNAFMDGLSNNQDRPVNVTPLPVNEDAKPFGLNVKLAV